MQRLTQHDGGLFPQPKEIDLKCSCPDWAGMCKHLAAVLYGVGARLDTAPELLFTLRNVDHLELISQAVDADNLQQTLKGQADAPLADSDLGEIFGIDLDVSKDAKDAAGAVDARQAPPRQRAKSDKRRGKKTVEQEAAVLTAAPSARSRKKASPVKARAGSRKAAGNQARS
jgi:uncharacterized Zn finger protein